MVTSSPRGAPRCATVLRRNRGAAEVRLAPKLEWEAACDVGDVSGHLE